MDKMSICNNQNEDGEEKKVVGMNGYVGVSRDDAGSIRQEDVKVMRLFSKVETGQAEESQCKQKLFDRVEGELCDNKIGQASKLFSQVVPPSIVPIQISANIETNMQDNLSEMQVNRKSGTKMGAAEVKTFDGSTDIIEATITETMTEDWKNFDLQLIKKIRRFFDTSGGEKSLVFYQFRILLSTECFETTVSAREVDVLKWVKTATDGKAYIKKGCKSMSFAEYVSKCITRCSVMEVVEYGTNGWKKIRSNHFYVLPKGNTGRFSADISGNCNTSFEVMEDSGDIKVFRQTLQMLNICNDQRITLPLFLFTYAGALTSVFDEAGFPIKFLLAVIGETNSRKTSLSLCMTKTFNRKEIQIPEITFSSPEGGIETKVSLHPDSVLVIDDFMPAATRSKQNILDAKLEKIIRIYGDRKGIDRMTDFARNPNAGYYPVKGVAVITGEHIRGVESSMTRCLIINVKPDSVNNNLLGFYQENYKILNSSLFDFLKFVTVHYEEVRRFISQKVPTYRALNLFNPPRYSEMYAVLMTVAEIFLQYSVSRNFLNDTERQQIYSQWEGVLRNVISENIAGLKDRSFGTIMLNVCKHIVENRCINALPEEGQANYDDTIFADDTYLYIRMETFIKEITRYAGLFGIDCPPLSKRYILNELERMEIIETKGKAEGKRTHKLPGSRGNGQRFVILKKDTIKNSQSTED